MIAPTDATLAAARRQARRVMEAARRQLRIANAIYRTTTLEHHGALHTLRFVRLLGHPLDAAWAVLTEMATGWGWFSPDPHDPRLQLFVCEPPHLLELACGADVLRFELSALGRRTELVLTHTVRDLGRAAQEAAQWELALRNLRRRLAGRPPVPDPAARLAESFAKYAWEFGSRAAATRGRSSPSA
jgi:hypothetical protein